MKHPLLGTEIAEAQPGQTITGHAGSLFDNNLIVYKDNDRKEGGVVVPFPPSESDAMWDLYCNDIEVTIGTDGMAQAWQKLGK